MKNCFTIDIAGCVFKIHAMYPSTERFCADYQSDKPPCKELYIDEADIKQERLLAEEEERFEGQPASVYSDAYLETLALFRKIAEELPLMNRFVFHGSALMMDEAGYIFTAKSGTGKSTHARLWRENFGERTVMVNDDKPIVWIDNDRAYVYGTPWNGKHRLGENICAPLKNICLLSRSVENHIEPTAKEDAYPQLLRQTYRPANAFALEKTLELLDDLVECVNVYRLGCNMEKEAAMIAYEGMLGRKTLPEADGYIK